MDNLPKKCTWSSVAIKWKAVLSKFRVIKANLMYEILVRVLIVWSVSFLTSNYLHNLMCMILRNGEYLFRRKKFHSTGNVQ